MFTFHADIIKRKKISIVSLFIGIIGASIIGYLLPPFLEYGQVNIVEDFIKQVGLQDYTNMVYLVLFSLLLFAIVPAFKTVFQKKVIKSGYIHFDEDNLKIVKGREKFLIPGEELQEVKFELKNPTANKTVAPGGSFMKIPTQKGTFVCEIDYNKDNHHKDLGNMIKVLKIKHEVKVAVKEIG